jgi:hypothetical protein
VIESSFLPSDSPPWARSCRQTGRRAQGAMVDGIRYVKGIVDAALSDYDVRDPVDM